MTKCPYCKIYWDYMAHEINTTGSISLSEEHFSYLHLKEQKEVIEHVAHDHAYILMTDRIENEL